uniref:Uncharacterized protein n=1 Tax=Arundo donax TaxID=35708 RepID=A0A0A9E686_ARUDO
MVNYYPILCNFLQEKKLESLISNRSQNHICMRNRITAREEKKGLQSMKRSRLRT